MCHRVLTGHNYVMMTLVLIGMHRVTVFHTAVSEQIFGNRNSRPRLEQQQ